ncbi:RES domain-containing protein [Cryobacterium sp. PH31-L1]|uniref:RES domain-containing protein n=1 Tax=Cryobacterium sp. PH31-L1 TaxID=3046199 RepID=UPI0024BAA742|nr:RES domain-containing protein [Cryobacterium sp. PH31-L1]MDJ0378501.1 RES domain-containing protein [Cryobacterium sp. PH31-L1]
MEFPPIGWTNKSVCLDHIEDEYLRARLAPDVAEHVCSFCPRTSTNGAAAIAVNLEHLAAVVAEVAVRFYEDAVNAPFMDGEISVQDFDTLEVVYNMLDDSLPASLLDSIVKSVAELIHEPQIWIRLDNVSYVEFGWSSFADTVKHTSRLVLAPRSGHAQEPTPPEDLYTFLTALSGIVNETTGLVQVLEAGARIYRARIERDAGALEREVQEDPAKKLGPAPQGSAAAGRMNAQGISLFYAAMEEETACAEVVAHSAYNEAVVGEFTVQQPLRIFDLTRVPVRPSIFDESAGPIYPFIAFFDLFRDAITQPVILDGKHPVDYAPTQVVTEFLRWGTQAKLDGIAWESRVVPDGKNIVLFYGPDTPMRSTKEPDKEESELWRLTFGAAAEPIFIIDPSSIRRYEAERTVSVRKSRW